VPFIDGGGARVVARRPLAPRAGRRRRALAERARRQHAPGRDRRERRRAAAAALATLDPAVPIVVYCAGGMRSAKAARVLIAAGHGDVRNLEGGIFAWANDGPADAVRRPRDALRASERREVGRVARARPARMDADAA
jgi:rhodanese-related sulfurtransferase